MERTFGLPRIVGVSLTSIIINTFSVKFYNIACIINYYVHRDYGLILYLITHVPIVGTFNFNIIPALVWGYIYT